VRALAFSVHILTACGAALALIALDAAVSGEWAFMFVVLGIALIVDSIDGPLARAVKVAERLPRWSGEVLDLLVDFTTYVFVPAYAIASAELMPTEWTVAVGPVIAMTGALYFADRNMKTSDNHFRGFPAVWNLVAFYLLLLRPTPLVSAATVAVFAVLHFVPVRFVHPLRFHALRPVTVTLLMLWAVLAAVSLYYGLQPEFWIKVALCAIAVYFLTAGLLPVRQP
jgi:phosphatidylcholine synthase